MAHRDPELRRARKDESFTRGFGRRFAGALLLAATALVAPAGAANDTPAALVDRFHAALVDVMRRGPELAYAGRQEVLEPTVRKVFDIPHITRAMLARHWAELSPPQRKKFTDTFVQLAVANLAFNFKKHDGETFTARSNSVLKSGRVRLRSEFTESDGDVVKFDYILHHTPGGWRVVNVYFDGVSERAIRGAEFSSILSRDGFDSLIERLEKTIAGFAKDGSS